MNTGIHKMTMEEYLSMNALSSGVCAKVLSESPFHARLASPWNDSRVQSESGTADIGTYAHAMLLEGGTDKLVVVDAEDWRTKAAKEARDAAYADGKTPILQKKVAAVESMVAAAKEYLARSEIAGIFDTGAPEQTLIWSEGETLCKARADWLSEDKRICLSYKTTAGSANPDSWIRTQLPQYDLATVFYERGVMAACKVEHTWVVHLVQDQSFPFCCSLIGLDPAYKDLASRKLDSALATWASCVATGTWPAYPTRICWAEPKAWQLNDAEAQEANRQQLTESELSGGIPA